MHASATHLFTRELDLLNIEKWEYKVEDKSLLSRLYKPLWEKLATLIPRSVAPNVVTLCAVVCIFQSYWLAYKYSDVDEYHSEVCYACALLTYLYMTLDAIDGMVARNTLNTSPLGEFFDHSCDNIAGSFIIITLLLLIGVDVSVTMWYIVQALQLASLSVHIRAFGDKERKIRFGYLTGPDELLHVIIFLMLFVARFGKEELWTQGSELAINLYNGYVREYVPCEEGLEGDALAKWIFAGAAQAAYWACNVYVGLQVVLLDSKYFATKFGFMLSLAMRAVPAILASFISDSKQSLESMESILSDGLFLSILCSDIIVAKMANRDLHSLVPVIAMLSILSNSIIFAAVALYHVTVIFDMCAFLNLPLLNPVINVYVRNLLEH